MKRTTSLVLLLLSAFLLTIGSAHALIDDTHSSPVLTPDQEKAMILERQAFLRDVARIQYVQAVQFQAAVYAAVLEQDRINDERQAREEPSRSPARVREASSGRCGGNLPPCYVMNRESGGDLRAENPVSTASGKWQFIDGTWNGYGGYSHASQAPEDVQDAKAAELWAGGAGCGHWSAC